MASERLEITKVNAARRQLETAVRLYFGDGDPVSIHTLTAAAHQVLADVSKARGLPPMRIDQWLASTIIKPEKREEARRFVRSAANFFKHAERPGDPDATFFFVESQSHFLLLDAVTQYRELTKEVVPVLEAYFAWYFLGPGKEFADPSQEQILARSRVLFAGATKASFFEAVIKLLRNP